MTEYEVDKAMLTTLIRKVESLGVVVEEDFNEPEGARFVGTFTGHRLVLFPKYDSNFALYFTVAHLYGHMVQMANGSKRAEAANTMLATILDPALAEKLRTFTPEQVQIIHDHEYEAAAIGRRVIDELGHGSSELLSQYARMFFADFHYLIHVLETGESGPEAFARFLRREPKPFRHIEPDERPLINVGHLREDTASKVTVV